MKLLQLCTLTLFVITTTSTVAQETTVKTAYILQPATSFRKGLS